MWERMITTIPTLIVTPEELVADNVPELKKRQPAAHGGGVRGDNSAHDRRSLKGVLAGCFGRCPRRCWPVEALIKLGHRQHDVGARNGEKDPKCRRQRRRIRRSGFMTTRRMRHSRRVHVSRAVHRPRHHVRSASSLMQQNDPDALVDFRTPRLDLDSLYGRGPAEQPYMYGQQIPAWPSACSRTGRRAIAGSAPVRRSDRPERRQARADR